MCITIGLIEIEKLMGKPISLTNEKETRRSRRTRSFDISDSRTKTVCSEKDIRMAMRSLRFNRCQSAIKIRYNASGKAVLEEPMNPKHGFQENLKTEVDAVPEISLEKCISESGTAEPTTNHDELWWKALDFASLRRSSISFFNDDKPESAISRWGRARTRAAKVGKGLSKNGKAQKLALQHWLEAIDPRHRYGHNLHFYYDVWFKSESAQPFFYWLDIGDGKELNLENFPRSILQHQCVTYLGPNEREAYEVIVENGLLVYKQTEMAVNTLEGSKWIFVLSTSREMYVGQKKKGRFQHSSFLAGGAATAAGRLVVKQGTLKAVWPYSGHYLPTEENFKEFITFLKDNNVDLKDVKTFTFNGGDGSPSLKKSKNDWGVKRTNGRDDSAKTEAEEYFDTETDESPRASPKSVFGMAGDDQLLYTWTAETRINSPMALIPLPRPAIAPTLANMSTINITLPKLKMTCE